MTWYTCKMAAMFPLGVQREFMKRSLVNAGAIERRNNPKTGDCEFLCREKPEDKPIAGVTFKEETP